MMDDTAVGIFFGTDDTQEFLSDSLVLDVRNASQLSFLDRYPISSATSNPSNNTIIGIAVGVSCVSFLFQKKERQEVLI